MSDAPIGPAGLTALERVVARDEITQLAYRYAWALDSRDIDLLVSLFVPDVRVGRDTYGRDALRAFWVASLEPLGPTFLNVGNHVIDVDGPDAARGLVYCRAVIEEADRTIEQAILYRDTYERRDGEWLFVRRIHELWFGVETAERPYDQPSADWPASSVGRGTIPWSLPSWRAFTGE